jgi:hypothetical protein
VWELRNWLCFTHLWHKFHIKLIKILSGNAYLLNKCRWITCEDYPLVALSIKWNHWRYTHIHTNARYLLQSLIQHVLFALCHHKNQYWFPLIWPVANFTKPNITISTIDLP